MELKKFEMCFFKLSYGPVIPKIKKTLTNTSYTLWYFLFTGLEYPIVRRMFDLYGVQA